MGTEHIIIFLGALAGGLVSGLAGFGTGLAALGIWLYALPPSAAASLVVICSVAAQVQTMPAIWRAIEAKRVVPFIVPGLVGVPLGTALMTYLDVDVLKLSIGCFLLVFSAYLLFNKSQSKITWGGRIADGAIGFGGGVLGGLAGLSGPLPTIWATVRGWTKGQSRGVFQAYNLSILGFALVSYAISGLLNKEVALAAMWALPGTIGGVWVGAHAYGRLSDQRFREIILTLLCISGGMLIWSNL
jgi:uncharacterized membrane protein YfcA